MMRDAVRVTPTEIRPILSDYLMAGYRDDSIVYDWFDVSSRSVSASVGVSAYSTTVDGGFHFTAPLAFVAVAQCAVVFAHFDLGLSIKTAEVLVRRIDLVFRREIRETTGIVVELTLTKRRETPVGVLYIGDISISDGAFSGTGSFFMPVGGVR